MDVYGLFFVVRQNPDLGASRTLRVYALPFWLGEPSAREDPPDGFATWRKESLEGGGLYIGRNVVRSMGRMALLVEQFG